MIKKISDLQKTVSALRDAGLQRGDDTGFKALDDLYSIKQGSFTIIQGPPGNGKSEIIFEILISQAEKYGKKSIILSPETGNAEDITMELIHKYLKQSAYKTSGYSCSDLDFYRALNWVDEHFAIADDDEKSYSLEDLAKEIAVFEKENKSIYDLVMAEPWNELNHKLALNANSGRQDLAIEDELTALRMYCKKNNKHVFLSFHPSYQELVKDKESGISYYPMPKAREAAGGQATLRKAFSWINIWRPPEGIRDPANGIPYLDNELIVQIEKSKPKGIGKRGAVSLFFDWKKNRYYEILGMERKYAFEHVIKLPPELPLLKPNTQFDTETTDSPF